MAFPKEELQCSICLETVREAVICVNCNKFFCEGHIRDMATCPVCRATPFLTAPNPALRMLADRVRVKCRFCERDTPRGELAEHEATCRVQPRRCSAAGCEFETADRKAAMTHIMTQHEHALWEDFEKVFKHGELFVSFSNSGSVFHLKSILSSFDSLGICRMIDNVLS